jgi:malate synthase
VLGGKGASLLDGYMEDLATDRIYRLMIAQRMRHSDLVRIEDEQGRAVKHTPEFITQLFDEELERLLSELSPEIATAEANCFQRARDISEGMIMSEEFNPV